VGSVVVGSEEFIARFKNNRKMMGGVMRKPGVVAGAGLIALEKMRHFVWKDNEIARSLSQKLINLGWIEVTIKT
jgi:threonine aldolase